jgi:hypothetical protein
MVYVVIDGSAQQTDAATNLRLAWETVVTLLQQNSSPDEARRPARGKIDEACDRLVCLTGSTQANMQATQIYLALQGYAMPDFESDEHADETWTMFHYLVSAIREGHTEKSEFYAMALAILADSTTHNKEWWRFRAIKYISVAGLGYLPAGTRV